MIDDIFNKLNISVTIKLNNRKILSGMARLIDEPEKLTDITTAIDKLDKVGTEKVVEELLEKGLPQVKIDQVLPIIELNGSNSEKLSALKKSIGHLDDGANGIDEIQTIFSYLNDLNIKSNVEFDQALARGLNYYTGAIIEVKANDVNIGSVCGGGRYDDLTGIFGLEGVSGVGVSFGADRIYDVLKEKNLFPQQVQHSADVMLVNFGEKEALFCLKLLEVLQESGISAELYPESDKMKKQMRYANSKEVKYVLLVGEEEISSGQYSLKDMTTGDQVKGNFSQLISRIKS
jgi:histidyl-tRNA synthetase